MTEDRDKLDRAIKRTTGLKEFIMVGRDAHDGGLRTINSRDLRVETALGLLRVGELAYEVFLVPAQKEDKAT